DRGSGGGGAPGGVAMMKQWWKWVKHTPLVRYPVTAVTLAKRLPLIQPAPIVISLEELAPVWLRHNHDFLSAQGEVGRTLTAPAMPLTVAVAPVAPIPASVVATSAAFARDSEKRASVMPSGIAMKRVQSSAFVRDFVVPYQGMLEAQGVLVPVLR